MGVCYVSRLAFTCVQSQLHCSEVDRDKLHQAKTDWTEERLTLKEQLKDMQDELSKFKVLPKCVLYMLL